MHVMEERSSSLYPVIHHLQACRDNNSLSLVFEFTDSVNSFWIYKGLKKRRLDDRRMLEQLHYKIKEVIYDAKGFQRQVSMLKRLSVVPNIKSCLKQKVLFEQIHPFAQFEVNKYDHLVMCSMWLIRTLFHVPFYFICILFCCLFKIFNTFWCLLGLWAVTPNQSSPKSLSSD